MVNPNPLKKLQCFPIISLISKYHSKQSHIPLDIKKYRLKAQEEVINISADMEIKYKEASISEVENMH